ncbi:MAG: ATP-binding cassette domain-containing protein [Lactobacillales bacterium]|nr:ATP-binding cassette domain-containing protein [Lactobacillales bacterium]
MSIYKKLSWFFKQEKKHYILGVGALFIVALIHLVPPKIIGMVIDEIDRKTITSRDIVNYLLILATVAVGEYIFRYIWRINIWGAAAKLEQNLRQQLFHHFIKMDNTFYQEHRTGDLMAHATNDLQAIQNVAGQGILTMADSIMTGSATIIAMILFIDWRLTLIALIPMPLLAVTSRVLGNKIHKAFKESQEAFSDLNDKTQESITGMKAIKTFGQEKEDIEDYRLKLENINEKNKRTNLLDSLFDPFITLIIGLSYVLTIIVGGKLVMNQSLSIGQLVSFVSYIGMLVWPMFAIGMLFNTLERGNASYDRVDELLSKKSHIVDNISGIATLANGDIEFHVDEFKYPSDEQVYLSEVNFTIKEGNTLGIVGKTGSGKTSIIKLLMREYDSYEGEISFGGEDVRDYRLDSLLPSIGYVPQDHFLFSMTVRDNIRFARPKATEEEVAQASKLANIDKDITQFPEGYETMVGERGVSLSGGQKQRISIARALMVNAELLILDDALSAVDAKTEETILENLKAVRNDKTTIITAHRLSSVMHADEIIVMDSGKVSERGTHEDLVASGGWYARMWERQQLEEKLEKGSER